MDYIGGYVIFNDITARDIQRGEMRSGVFSLLQGDRHVLPARAVDRDARRDPRPARPRDGAARQRRGAAGVALGPHVRDDPGDPLQLLGARLLGRRRPLDRHGRGRRGLQVAEERGVALPEAGRRHRGGDRADRRAAQPGDLLAGGARRAAAAAACGRWGETPELAARRREARARARADGASRSSTRSSSARPTTSST